VAPGKPFTSTGNTAAFTNYFGAYCEKLGASGRDTVFKVLPEVAGKVTVRLTANDEVFDPVLAVSQSECTVFVTNKDGVCANYSGPGFGEELEVEAKGGVPFWVYVDAPKGGDGAFTLLVTYEGE
jgi:hypothetical protein